VVQTAFATTVRTDAGLFWRLPSIPLSLWAVVQTAFPTTVRTDAGLFWRPPSIPLSL